MTGASYGVMTSLDVLIRWLNIVVSFAGASFLMFCLYVFIIESSAIFPKLLHPCAVPPCIHQMPQENKLVCQHQRPLPSRFVPAQQSVISDTVNSLYQMASKASIDQCSCEDVPLNGTW